MQNNSIDLSKTKSTSIKKWVSLIVIFVISFFILQIAITVPFMVLHETLLKHTIAKAEWYKYVYDLPLILTILLILFQVNRTLKKDIRSLVKDNLELQDEIIEIDLNKEYEDELTEKVRKSYLKAKLALNLSEDIILIRSKENIYNAFAISNLKGKAIVVFDGLTKQSEENQLQAIIGHEIGHILNKDAIYKILDYSIIYFIPYAQYTSDYISTHLLNFSKKNIFLLVFMFPIYLTAKIIFVFISIFNYILNYVRAFASKQAEHLADYIGMVSSPNNSMIEALETIKEVGGTYQTNESVLMRLLAEHPQTDKRILYLNNIN